MCVVRNCGHKIVGVGMYPGSTSVLRKGLRAPVWEHSRLAGLTLICVEITRYARKEFRQTHLCATLIVGLFITHEFTRHARYICITFNWQEQ